MRNESIPAGFILFIVGVGLVAFGLVKWGESTAPQPLPANSSQPHVWVDKQTSCHWVWTDEGGLTPRLLATGQQWCDDNLQEEEFYDGQ